MKCLQPEFRDRVIRDLRNLRNRLNARGVLTSQEDERIRHIIVYMVMENSLLQPLLQLAEEADEYRD
jgi:hypothetical protein